MTSANTGTWGKGSLFSILAQRNHRIIGTESVFSVKRAECVNSKLQFLVNRHNLFCIFLTVLQFFRCVLRNEMVFILLHVLLSSVVLLEQRHQSHCGF